VDALNRRCFVAAHLANVAMAGLGKTVLRIALCVAQMVRRRSGYPTSPGWRLPASRTVSCGMDTVPRPGDSPPSADLDTEAAKQRRFAREAEMIAEARASAAAGRVVSSEEVNAWINRLDTEHERPAPSSGR
jgi:hypothetical protein